MITEIKLTRTAHGFGQITVDAINAGIYLTKKNEWKAKLVGQSVVLKGPKGVDVPFEINIAWTTAWNFAGAVRRQQCREHGMIDDSHIDEEIWDEIE